MTTSDTLYNKDISIKFDELYIEALLDILVFASQTASFLAHREATNGKAGKDMIRFARIANDSNDIVKFLKNALEIGEPDLDSIN